MKKTRFRDFSFWLIIYFLISLITFLQLEFYSFKKIYPLILDKDLFTIYSLIAGILSLFGIFYAFFQFAIDRKEKNEQFFGINYFSKELNNSFIFNFSRSRALFSLLVLFSLLPILYKLYDIQIIAYLWASTFVLVIMLFLFVLFGAIEFIVKSSNIDYDTKRISCLTIKQDEIADNYKMLLKNNKLPEKTFATLLAYSIDQSLQNIEEKIERNIFLNHIIEKIPFDTQTINQEFLNEFFNQIISIYINNDIPLIFSKSNGSFIYPFLEKITCVQNKMPLSNKIIGYQNNLLNLIKKEKNNIMLPLLIDFILRNIKWLDFQESINLLEIVSTIPGYDESELIFQLLNQGKLLDIDPKIDRRQKRIILLWHEFFKNTLILNKKVKLPHNGYISYLDGYGEEIPFETLYNLFSIAVITYLLKNKLKNVEQQRLLETLDDECKKLYKNINNEEESNIDLGFSLHIYKMIKSL